MTKIAAELAKVRADPDYYPPICLGCGRTFAQWPEPDDHSLEAELIRLDPFVILPVDSCEILCGDCVDAEVIQQAVELGEWGPFE